MRKSLILASIIGIFIMAAPAMSQTAFSASLDGSQIPGGTTSTATGTASLSLNAAQDTLTYTLTLVGLDLDGLQTMDPNDDVTNAHIHVAPAGSNGPIAFGMIGPLDDTDDIVIDPVAGTITGAWETTDTLTFGGTLTDFLADLDAGNLYLNIHTPAYPAGAIRGQIGGGGQLPIPTLGTVGLAVLLLVLLAAGVVVLRRRDAIA